MKGVLCSNGDTHAHKRTYIQKKSNSRVSPLGLVGVSLRRPQRQFQYGTITVTRIVTNSLTPRHVPIMRPGRVPARPPNPCLQLVIANDLGKEVRHPLHADGRILLYLGAQGSELEHESFKAVMLALM